MPQGRVLCAVALLVACAEAGCAGPHQTTAAPVLAPPPPRSAPAPAQSGTSTVSNLRTAIDRIVSAPGLERATWGIAVESLDRRDVLVAVNADRLLLPSSTMKIVTLAAAATRLGWDYVFETRLIAAGRRTGGVLEGDLLVVGGGDPSLDDWDGSASRIFREWAQQLRDAGITTVTGRLVGDANVFDQNTLGAGWAWDDLDRSFATEVSGLQFNQNSAQLVIEPGPTVGEAATVTVIPAWTGLTIAGTVRTDAGDAPPRIVTRRQFGRSVLDVSGSVPVGGGRMTRTVSVPHPPQYLVTALRRVLVDNGIEIRGPTVEADNGTNPPPADAIVLSHRSPPLALLADTMMKQSQNLYAETLLKALGSGSWPAGLSETQSLLAAWTIPAGSIVQADGSGLSRYNYATASALVSVLKQMDADGAHRARFRATLPVAGHSGTLEHRLRGTAAEGRVTAKTGSMSNARSLAGYTTTASGESLVFAVIANNFGASAEPVDRAIDAIATEIVTLAR